MLKKEITYTDFDGNEQTETFYFNLPKAELIRMEARAEGETYQDRLKRIVKSDNKALIVAEFESFILDSYGIRVDDGKRFVKNDEVREAFKQTAAYDELLFSFFADGDSGSAFINGIMPKSLMDEVNAEMQNKTPAQIARERSEANMQGHLTRSPSEVTGYDAQDQATLDFEKAERRRSLQAQLDELND